MKNLIFLPLLSIFCTAGLAQNIEGQTQLPQKMTLNGCISYAIAHNTGVKKQELKNNIYRQDRINAAASLLPSASGSIYVQNNYGRGVDPETNTYINTETFYNTYSVETSMPLFAGLSNINTYRASKLMQKAGVEQLKIQKDNVALNAMQAFMNVVYYSASVDIAQKQLATSSQTLAQSKKMLELGLKSAADVAQIETQVAGDDLTLTQQQNELNLAMLTLKEQMNYPIDSILSIDTCLSTKLSLAQNSINDVVSFALENNPKILQSGYNVNRAKMNYKIALGKMFPSISIYAGYQTQYYDIKTSSTVFPSFSDQIRDNRGTYVGAKLYIPIFSGLDRKTTLSKAKYNQKIAECENEEVKRALQTEITQTILQMEGYGKEYVQATKKVEAAELAHRASIQKFSKGLVSPIELQTTANELIRAKSQQLNARLQKFIKHKMVRYYNGESLVEG